MKVLNKLIYADSYTIPANSTQEIFIPNLPLDEYIINKDANVQYIIYFTSSHTNFDILNIKRAILINRSMGPFGFTNTYFYSLINFEFVKEKKSILLKDIKEKMFRIYTRSIDISNPAEFLTITIQNTDTLSDLDIYFELRELNAVLL